MIKILLLVTILMHPLGQDFIKKLASGLQRSSLTEVSVWAERYRVMGKPFPGPWSFLHHPWLKAMHNSPADMNIGQKSAQMGFTETLLNWTFKKIDIDGESCLYVLPTEDDSSDFSASRFDPAIEDSPHLKNLFTSTKNVGHKRAGSANLFIRGSRSKSKLKSIPVANVAIDELDEMVTKNIPLIFERQSGQELKQTWMISTPTVEDYGINEYFEQSSKNHFFFKCPSCNRFIELSLDNVKICGDHINDPQITQSYYFCSACKAILPHQTKSIFLANNEWVPENSDANTVGWYINQLYSCTITPVEFVTSYLLSLSNLAYEQQLYNSKLGLPHVVKGGRVTLDQINACQSNYTNGEKSRSPIITMGVDVGKWLHYEIDEWYSKQSLGDINDSSEPKVLEIGKVADFENLDSLIKKYGISHTTVDANPERRKAFELANRFPGLVSNCFYVEGSKTRNISEPKPLFISVDRTSWLDLSLGRFQNGTIKLPADTPLEYKAHVQALVKKYDLDTNGNPVSNYLSTKDDHFAHARNYAEIALTRVLSLGSQDIRGAT